MKRIILGVILLLGIMSIVGCAGGSAASQNAPKQQFTITIDTNPTTGFDYVCSIEGDAIKLVDENIVSPNQNSDPKHMIVGVGSQRTYTFEVVEEGAATIDLNYKRNWEGGEDAWDIFYEIEVDENLNAKLYDKNVQDNDLHFQGTVPDPVF